MKLLVVPGNHDVPLYDLARRFGAPLRRYKRYISNDLCPFFEDDAVAILGLNTARSLTIKDGRINHDQMDMLRASFASVARSEEHTSELKSLMRSSYAVFCLKKN